MRHIFRLVALSVVMCAVGCRGDRPPAGPNGNAGRPERYATVVFLSGSEFFNWAHAGMRDARPFSARTSASSCRGRPNGMPRSRRDPSNS